MVENRLAQWSLVKNLKIWQKCALIALPFLLPVAALVYLVVTQNNDAIAVVQSELHGLEYLRPVKKLTAEITDHRGLTARVANGDTRADAERATVGKAIEDTIREVDAIDARFGKEFRTPETKRWVKFKEDWSSIKASSATLSAKDNFQQHTNIMSSLLELSTDVWEFSTLALDPVADTYYLQDMIVARAIPGIEDIGQLNGILAATMARTKSGTLTFSDAERLKINVLLGQIEQTRAAIEKETRRATEANVKLKGKLEDANVEYQTKTTTFANTVRAILDSKAGNGLNAEQVYQQGQASVTALTKLYEAYEPNLIELLNTRMAAQRQTNLLSVGGTLFALLLVAIVALVVTKSITTQVGALNGVFARIEQGDYKSRAEITSDDELGQMTRSLNKTLDGTLALIQSRGEKEEIQSSIMRLLDEVSGVADGDLTKEAEVSADMTGAIADSFNFMIDQLRKIIGTVQQATLQVSTAANEISASAEDLATGSEHQADQIVSTSAAIDAIALSIQQVSENAATSTTVAQQALQSAKQGNAAVKNTIEGMNKIREQAQETAKRIKRLGETSQEIGQIVQLIDDIADRTSILALNASIQAAAAGDAGRGFAVVAEEVERLAVRSTEATKKIATLVKAIQGETNEAVTAMEKSIQEVVNGSKVANQAGQSLQEIEGVSLKLSELILSISQASKQQARGSDALAKSMTDISTITQQTATGTKQTAESVSSLARLADELRESVSTFRLPNSGPATTPNRTNYADEYDLVGAR